MKKLAVVLFSSLLIANAAADIYFDDGGNHTISYVINGSALVDYSAPGVGTTVTLVDGGSIGTPESSLYTLRAFEDGIINVVGGFVSGSLVADGRSLVTMSGGYVVQSAVSMDQAQLIVSGGSFRPGVIANVAAYNNSNAYVSGGDMDCFFAGRYFGEHYSLITLDGYNFQINGQSVDFGAMARDYAVSGTDPYGNSCLTGTITGTLLDGNTLNNGFYIFDEANITFVPEPATILFLGLGALMLRRKAD